jgi:uncharacterized protein (DUF4415 family)
MNKVKYSEAPADVEAALDAAVRVKGEFLPSPEYFAKMLAKEKISLNIDRHTIDRFRAYAKKHDLKYQALINQVLGSYAKNL